LCYRCYQVETFPLPLGVAGVGIKDCFRTLTRLSIKLGSRPGAMGDFRYRESQKKDSGSARQGETANTVNVRLPESP